MQNAGILMKQGFESSTDHSDHPLCERGSDLLMWRGRDAGTIIVYSAKLVRSVEVSSLRGVGPHVSEKPSKVVITR